MMKHPVRRPRANSLSDSPQCGISASNVYAEYGKRVREVFRKLKKLFRNRVNFYSACRRCVQSILEQGSFKIQNAIEIFVPYERNFASLTAT